MTNKDVYNFQNRIAEPLIHANWGDSGWTGPRIYIENAGDILREFSKYSNGWVADSYINEKIDRIEYGLSKYINFEGSNEESYENMVKENEQLVKQITLAYEIQPTITDGQELARKIALSLCKGQFNETKKLLDEFKRKYKELKQKNLIKENIMKKSELKQLIKEVYNQVIKESDSKNILDLPIEKQKKIIAQYEAIRRKGQYNMFDFHSVQRAAYHNGFYDFVNFTQNNSRAYASILQNYNTLIKLIDLDEVPITKKIITKYEIEED